MIATGSSARASFWYCVWLFKIRREIQEFGSGGGGGGSVWPRLPRTILPKAVHPRGSLAKPAWPVSGQRAGTVDSVRCPPGPFFLCGSSLCPQAGCGQQCPAVPGWERAGGGEARAELGTVTAGGQQGGQHTPGRWPHPGNGLSPAALCLEARFGLTRRLCSLTAAPRLLQACSRVSPGRDTQPLLAKQPS